MTDPRDAATVISALAVFGWLVILAQVQLKMSNSGDVGLMTMTARLASVVISLLHPQGWAVLAATWWLLQ